MAKDSKMSRLWAEIKRHPAWYIIGTIAYFAVWGFPVGFLQSWPALVRDKTFPEWLAERGFSLSTLVILWITAALVLTAVAASVIVRRISKRANHDIAPILTDSQKPTEPQLPEVRELGQRYEIKEIQPNLIFRQYSMVGAHEEQGQIVERNNGRDLTFHAVVAEFNNRVDSNQTTVSIDRVSAALSYTFYDKRAPVEINRGIWLSHGSKVDFDINDTHRLMIATLEGDFEERQVYALNGSYSLKGPRRVCLSEPLVKVDVRLVGESRNRILGQFEFMLEVSRDSKFLAELRLTELSRWKSDRLFDLYVRGNNLLNKYNTQKTFASYGGLAAVGWEEALEEIEQETNVWANDASNFFATHFSEKHQFRFIKAVSPKKEQRSYDLGETIKNGMKVIYERIQEVGGLAPDRHDLGRLVKTFGPFFPDL